MMNLTDLLAWASISALAFSAISAVILAFSFLEAFFLGP